MAELSKLNDQQNMILTQLSYYSHVLKDEHNKKTIKEIVVSLEESNKKSYNEDRNKAINLMNEICDAGIGDLKIKDFSNDNITGFGAIAYSDEKGAVGFSLRGTDGLPNKDNLNDWLDNIMAALLGTSLQTVQAEVFFDKNRDAKGKNYLHAHSKGGELAESVFVNNYKKIKAMHLLNPQPINPYSLTNDQLEAMQSEKVDIIVVEGDYVWLTGSQPTFSRMRIANSNGGDSHFYSSLRGTFDENGNITPGRHPEWEFAAISVVPLIFTKPQIYGGIVGFTYNCVVMVVDYVKSDLILEAKEFIAKVSEKLKKIDDEMKVFAEELKDFLLKTIDNVRNWQLKLINREGISFTDIHQICVDTTKLRNYAQRLQSVNSRISKLNGRINSLYWSVGLLGLWNLLQADMLTGYNWRLNKCSSYLYETANDLEQIENNLKNTI